MFNQTMSGSDWINSVVEESVALAKDITIAGNTANSWASLIYGKADADILAMPQFVNWTETELTALKGAIGVFQDLYNAMNNLAAIPQANRLGYLQPFLG